MNLGLPNPSALTVILLGVMVLAVLGTQMLVGYRKIRFKGRRHQQVHRWVAWAMVGVALLHALVALAYVGVFG